MPPTRARWQLFGEQGIIDLIGVNGYYSFIAMMMNVARTKPDAGSTSAAGALSRLTRWPPTPPATASPGSEPLLKAAARASGPAPVEKWNPPYCGDIGMHIRADGVWLYSGSPIGRMPLVKLFAGVLRKDADGKHYLVTPAEKVDVDVADAPFLAVEMEVQGSGREQSLVFRTNVDDIVIAGPRHPLRFAAEPGSQGLKPYLLVRGRLEALVTRALYYDLVELAVDEGNGLGLWSGRRVLCDGGDTRLRASTHRWA